MLHSAIAGPLRHKSSTADSPSDARAKFARGVVFEREGSYGSAQPSAQANTFYDIAMMWFAIGLYGDCADQLNKDLELAPKAAARRSRRSSTSSRIACRMCSWTRVRTAAPHAGP